MRIVGVRGHKAELDDMLLAKTIADYLEKEYPLWGWMVHVDSEGGVVNVVCGRLLSLTPGKTYGYTMKISGLQDPSEIKRKAILAGGELLERAGMRRGGWSEGQEPVYLDKG